MSKSSENKKTEHKDGMYTSCGNGMAMKSSFKYVEGRGSDYTFRKVVPVLYNSIGEEMLSTLRFS